MFYRQTTNAKWDAGNLKRLSLAVRTPLYELMVQHIARTGESMNGFINRAITETIEKEKE